MAMFDSLQETIDGFLAWLGGSLGQSAEYYCTLESARNKYTLIARDGSLVSILKCQGITYLVGAEEFGKLHAGVTNALNGSMSRSGHGLQMFFCYDPDPIKKELTDILLPAKQTAQRLDLDLDDVFEEKVDFLAQYCAFESMYLVLWTMPSSLDQVRLEQANKDKKEKLAKAKLPKLISAQNILAALPGLEDGHRAYVKSLLDDMRALGYQIDILDIHQACHAIRTSVDKEFTDLDWRAFLPGDKVPARVAKNFPMGASNLLWPPLPKQLIPRDGENINLRTTRIGDHNYASVYIDLFPQNVQAFVQFFRRILSTNIPWRLSFHIESNGLTGLGLKPIIASILNFASNDNKLINAASDYLKYLEGNTDEAIVQLKACATTWADATEPKLIRTRLSELSKALQGWGSMDTSEVCGDPYQGAMSSALGLSMYSVARASIAPLSEVTYMFPLTRPASPWNEGAVLFRSPDGKPWPYQPGSSLQTTWIDLIYARPGSGKSVLSNTLNFALCLHAGLTRLPRISIIDIGPSSSGFISLLKEALPPQLKHLVAYHRLQMDEKTAINPFDTQLGSRKPTPQERAFLVNFLSLLATPVGQAKAYDGITDMAGLIIDELYNSLKDDAKPHPYTPNIDPMVDKKIQELGIKPDSHTTWWEIVDSLFDKGETHIATLAQRYAMPLLADAASICRSQAVEDLYGNIKVTTGETLINAFGRMISSAIREYPILSKITTLDLGEARVISLDLDDVAKTGGEAADRQTAIMYMLARFVLARNFYLVEELVSTFDERYREYHAKRIKEIREDPKRIVYDEFHRTASAQSVRDQVIVDMREGRKWKVHVALLSQSIEDFDKVMIEFATSIFILDAGPNQAVEKTTATFGLSPTARETLEAKVHGPKADGANMLAIFATKYGVNTQLITSTIGPIELWAFNTSSDDVRIRNQLYKLFGAKEARKFLAKQFPSGSASSFIEQKLSKYRQADNYISKEKNESLIDGIIDDLLKIHNEMIRKS